jgi:hypothetical protein
MAKKSKSPLSESYQPTIILPKSKPKGKAKSKGKPKGGMGKS